MKVRRLGWRGLLVAFATLLTAGTVTPLPAHAAPLAEVDLGIELELKGKDSGLIEVRLRVENLSDVAVTEPFDVITLIGKRAEGDLGMRLLISFPECKSEPTFRIEAKFSCPIQSMEANEIRNVTFVFNRPKIPINLQTALNVIDADVELIPDLNRENNRTHVILID